MEYNTHRSKDFDSIRFDRRSKNYRNIPLVKPSTNQSNLPNRTRCDAIQHNHHQSWNYCEGTNEPRGTDGTKSKIAVPRQKWKRNHRITSLSCVLQLFAPASTGGCLRWKKNCRREKNNLSFFKRGSFRNHFFASCIRIWRMNKHFSGNRNPVCICMGGRGGIAYGKGAWGWVSECSTLRAARYDDTPNPVSKRT